MRLLLFYCCQVERGGVEWCGGVAVGRAEGREGGGAEGETGGGKQSIYF